MNNNNIKISDFGKNFVEWLQIVQNEIKDDNNRSTAIVCASILDTQLENLLKKALYTDKNIDKKLFSGANSILSTFSSKITMAFYLRIISENEMKLLNEIRKIRNMFAHEIDISKGQVSNSIKDRCLNLTIPQGMFVPVEAFIGDINQIDLTYNPNDEKDPMKRFINSFFCLAQYLFLHNLEFLKIVDQDSAIYNTPKLYEFLELFRDLLRKENEFILEHLQVCMKKAKSDCKILKDMLIDFQDGDIIEFRNEKISISDGIKAYISILENEYSDFEKELRHRQLDIAGNEQEEMILGNSYENTGKFMDALSILIDRIKQITK